MELLDVYDSERMKTGGTMVRGEKIKPGEYHLIVHVVIFNAAGEMLIQHRQPFKHGWPDLWDLTVGGSASCGESSRTGAEREVLEEIGYRIDLSNTRPSLTVNFDTGFDDIYILEREVDIRELCLQYEEVKEVKWATLDEIFAMIDAGAFIPYYKSLIQLLFDMRGGLGAHKK